MPFTSGRARPVDDDDDDDDTTYLNMTMPRMVCFCSEDQFNGSRGSDVGWGCSLMPFLSTVAASLTVPWATGSDVGSSGVSEGAGFFSVIFSSSIMASVLGVQFA